MSTDTDPTDTRASYVPVPVRFDFDALAPATSKAVADLHQAAIEDLAGAGVDPQLVELVRLRASQINGCAYCVDAHARDARRAGVSDQRVDAVVIWPDAPTFTEVERAALALTDSVTRLSETRVPDSVVARALRVLGQERTAAILGLIVSINAWNEIGVTSRCWAVPGRER
jgi:AhpD family alkylhydroperoxidase